MHDTNLIGPNELASTLNVPVTWVYRQTREKGPDSIPVLKVGKYCRFRLADVMQWLDERSNTTANGGCNA